MTIKLNGKDIETGGAISISALLGKYFLQGKPLVVELNGIIIKRVQYDDVRLNEGDVLEIVRLVGGG
ncbi:MAG: sulfur carrier protein ThiS [bacterium]|nr:sulfur carrier protein ThiS [bacterium]